MISVGEMIQQKLAYTRWAHERVWACIMSLSHDQFDQPLDYSVGSIKHQVVHTMWAEETWLCRMQGVAGPAYTAADFADRAAIQQHWLEVQQRLTEFADGLTDHDFDKVISYSRGAGQQQGEAVWQMLTQIINHGTDHRAQMLAMMHTLGAETVAQDYIYHVREMQS